MHYVYLSDAYLSAIIFSKHWCMQWIWLINQHMHSIQIKLVIDRLPYSAVKQQYRHQANAGSRICDAYRTALGCDSHERMCVWSLTQALVFFLWQCVSFSAVMEDLGKSLRCQKALRKRGRHREKAGMSGVLCNSKRILRRETVT